ncbi:L,D-transpeptidase family protein [Rhodoplanes serenus]|uniref:L,D-transpeptidase family protein n=2 Tax=Rhodoplanes serenus TaxID=200615 RepID=A0A9X5AUM9_9BRAD|nr:L,D-transpeptidase family protein [Rhodoplanes serenus]
MRQSICRGYFGEGDMARSAKLHLVVGAVAAMIAGTTFTPAKADPLALFAPDGYRTSRIDPYISDERIRLDQADETRTVTPAHLRRQVVAYGGSEAPGTIVVDTPNTYLYLVLGGGKAMRYGIGVGREGFTWSGVEQITRMSEWPDWTPPSEMLQRQPYLPRFMAGGPGNPMGARAMYLGNTVYRIHGTNDPSTIGKRVSSGCIRLANEDVMDLYARVKPGATVVVLPMNGRRTVGAPSRPAAAKPTAAKPVAAKPVAAQPASPAPAIAVPATPARTADSLTGPRTN